MKLFWVLFSILLVDLSAEAGNEILPDKLSSEQLEFFESKVRPILAEHCYDCHSNQAKKLKGKLFLDSKWGWATGGVGGAAIIPGDLVESMVIDAVRHTEELVDAMPPKYKIEDEEIAILEKWVSMGAPDPRPRVEEKEGLVEVFDLPKRFAEHWSWRPVQPTKPPLPGNSEWASSEVDQFILHQIEQADLQPALPANTRTWIRRLYFDLIGLPPTPEQLANSLNKSKEFVVDELLASPHFGEKWARHWMDLVRYADTYGHEFDFPIKNAHEYRDYLVRAFNNDVPYDDFIREHLAGDLIKEPRRHPTDGFNESVIGTGFWYFHDSNHGPTDVLQNEADHQDNQIDVMGKTFQGLTIACARCHDHKFDAISTADYYALTGYLNGSALVKYPLDIRGIRQATIKTQSSIREKAKDKMVHPTHSPKDIIDSFLAAAKLVREKHNQPPPNPWDGELIEDFESDTFTWKLVNKDSNASPILRTDQNMTVPNGVKGKGWFDTRAFVVPAASSPEMPLAWLSPAFIIKKPYLNFLIGGGLNPNNNLELLVDAKVVKKASPKVDKVLSPAHIDASQWVGKNARLRISWRVAHPLFLDYLVFSDFKPNHQQNFTPNETELAQLSLASKLPKEKLMVWTKLLTRTNPDPWTPEKFLTDWITQGDKTKTENWQALDKTHQRYLNETKVFADFSSGKLPVGWHRTGQAFHPSSKGIRMNKKLPFSGSGTIDSSLFGNKRVGTLRSPTFEIDQVIHIKMNADHAFVRLVIENYQMAPFSELLFKGSVFKEDSRQTNSQGAFKWIRFEEKLYKTYAGKKAYLEFIDNGDGFVEIEQVRMAGPINNKFPLPHSHHPFKKALTLNGVPKNDEEMAQRMLKAWESNDPEILNWFFDRGLANYSHLEPELTNLIKEGEKISNDLPAPRFALTMGQATPENAYVYVRGSHKSLGQEVSNRYLEALGAKEGDRLTLANQIASPENPLTSRVMVNRIWLQLFGRGIVPTPDDFGPQGRPPSHPKLLDWLANDFSRNGWSVKRVIRKLVLSKTYGQSSRTHPELDIQKIADIDPSNLLLHRMPVRRLQAEAIRDSLLAVSGRLDPKPFGTGVPTHRTAFMTGRGSRASGPLDGAGRRSIYQAVYRNFLSPFLLAFDMPSPFGPKGRRSTSNVPAQALTLMNDPFVQRMAVIWAKNTASIQDPHKRAKHMFEQAVGQIPNESKTNQLLTFLDRQGQLYGKKDHRAWSDLAHALFNLKEFSYNQ
ncbi:MAG: PSD1 and planctomycete cytochrome C domain-containing protein [Opitutales bacterium]|nr:PSD1 and planctomycete cytochrome C domain-containing protein [Opitutales bacterium]